MFLSNFSYEELVLFVKRNRRILQGLSVCLCDSVYVVTIHVTIPLVWSFKRPLVQGGYCSYMKFSKTVVFSFQTPAC